MTAPVAATDCDLLITGGPVITLDDELGTIAQGAVAVVDGVIVDVGESSALAGRWRPRERLDTHGGTLVPGFTDQHVHLGSFLRARASATAERSGRSAGLFADGGDIAAIVELVARACAEPLDPRFTYAAARPVLAAMLRSGFTGVVDAGGPAPAGIVEAAKELGIRAAIGPSLADTWSDDGTEAPSRRIDTDAALAAATEFVAATDSTGQNRVVALLSCVDPLACSDELLTGMAELVARTGVPMHAHVNCTANHVPVHRALHGNTPIERLADFGLLGPGTTAMHAVYLSDREVRLLARTGTTVNHNPLGNAFLGFGVAAQKSVPRLTEAGVPVVLGSDTAPNWIPGPFDLIHAALLLQRDAAMDDEALSCTAALAMTVGGAGPLGRGGGAIAPGKLADLVVVGTVGPKFYAAPDPVSAVALQAAGADVTHTIVDGRIVVADSELVGIDAAQLVADWVGARRELDEMR
ncbi:amidohydrolase family protein [Nocardia sp. NPDC051321]|uniref:amidohydrolase family protein n=1 Tax=Nocardia sp. NPDC051321 TaxID=3364323 RepID=UPI0037A25675